LPHALYPRSVCWITIAFCGLRCHPLACIVLKLRLSVDSTPTRFRHFALALPSGGLADLEGC
jgi:hypothetical protein